MDTTTFKDSVTNAIRYWERGRILYNAALLAVAAVVFCVFWPQSRAVLSVDLGLGLFVLAVLANVAYCAAYPVDLLLQCSGFRATWLRIRWGLFVIGTVFAIVIAQFFARGMFGPSV